MIERHKVKFLNLSLLLYLALGVLVFDYLGEFQQPEQQPQQRASGKQSDKAKSLTNLAELRLNSVRKMWNITNQLNILYESNWTLLVLDELIEFESRLMDLIKVNEREAIDLELELELDSEEDKNRRENADADRREEAQRKRKQQLEQQRRSKSIKKSIVHSLATITTIGK